MASEAALIAIRGNMHNDIRQHFRPLSPILRLGVTSKVVRRSYWLRASKIAIRGNMHQYQGNVGSEFPYLWSDITNIARESIGPLPSCLTTKSE